MADVARYLGFTSPLYRVVDLSQEQEPHHFGRGIVATLDNFGKMGR